MAAPKTKTLIQKIPKNVFSSGKAAAAAASDEIKEERLSRPSPTLS
jgi:hypothetical protein